MVQHYGGTVDKFTGDGIMAVFGAPAALEDHALRACLAALGIQEEVARLASEVERRDGVDLRLRVGLNSGQVIAGEIGSAALGYTAIGEQVGMAQRMESVAPPGAVMLSESTARLVEGTAVLGEPQLVRIKVAEDAVPARRLLSVAAATDRCLCFDVGGPRLGIGHVARCWTARSVDVAPVAVVGPPGIGKTRLTAEAVPSRKALASRCFPPSANPTPPTPVPCGGALLRATGPLSGLEMRPRGHGSGTVSRRRSAGPAAAR